MSEPGAPDTGPRPRWPRPLPRPAVLVVDDDPALRKLLRISYESSGWGVLEAENGHEGVLAAVEHRPELLVLDLLMPVMGGFQALQQLDDLGILAETVVVVLSGVDDGPILRRASQALGVRRVCTKPVDPLELVVESMALVTADPAQRPQPT
jgi:CheY-like chemotaxis protein